MRHPRWLVALVLVLAFAAAPARAQFTELAQQAWAPLRTQELAPIAKLLALNADQQTALANLQVAAAEAHQKRVDAVHVKFLAYRQVAKDHDPAAPDIEKAYSTAASQLWKQRRLAREGLFHDAQSILTPAQQERWPAVERFFRRQGVVQELDIAFPWLRIDLIQLFEDLDLSAADRELIAPALADYENEIDIPAARYLELSSQEYRIEHGEDPQRFANEQVARRDFMRINRARAKQIAALLPEESARRFETELDHTLHAIVYKFQDPAKAAFDKLSALDDLSDAAREKLAHLNTDFTAKSADLAKRILATYDAYCAKFETDDPPGATPEQHHAAVDEAHKAYSHATADRWDLDHDTLEAIAAILTPEQQARAGIKVPKNHP